ncbi:MAG TPA: carboxypeptidase regulatory-like domain-containing protein, partial [Pyrinomonadaceae bacterium]|nr:carboxypeptidase regulatory-like domain-containing protein [Pyrinomonadaceae bacterium]
YMNYYASGLNDGNGTLDVRDATGYRQFTITAPGQTPPIRITSEPQSRATGLLASTNLSVSANGNGDPLTYQWRKNGVALTDGGTISGATTANLSISSTVAADAGYYDVLVRKPGAIVTSQAAIITVLSPTAANVSVSGRVLTPNSRGLMNATVMLIDASGNPRTARTNQFGYFHFDDVQAGRTYVVDIKSKSYSFAPQIVNVLETLTGLNFTMQ